MHTDAPSTPGLRDRPLGKAAILVAVLVAAFLVTKSCGSRETEISKEEAVEIARAKIDYEPDRVMTRFVPRGIHSRPNWAVSLATEGDDGRLDRVTVIVVDGETGQIVETRIQSG